MELAGAAGDLIHEGMAHYTLAEVGLLQGDLHRLQAPLSSWLDELLVRLMLYRVI